MILSYFQKVFNCLTFAHYPDCPDLKGKCGVKWGIWCKKKKCLNFIYHPCKFLLKLSDLWHTGRAHACDMLELWCSWGYRFHCCNIYIIFSTQLYCNDMSIKLYIFHNHDMLCNTICFPVIMRYYLVKITYFVCYVTT